MEKTLIIIKPKSLSSRDREKLSKNGFIVIEHESPDDVKIINPLEYQSDDLLRSALIAVSSCSFSEPQVLFTKELNRRIKVNDSKPNQNKTKID